MIAFPLASARGRKAKRWEGESMRSDIDGGRIDNGRIPTGTASNIKRFLFVCYVAL
jgi:hypothetical protein